MSHESAISVLGSFGLLPVFAGHCRPTQGGPSTHLDRGEAGPYDHGAPHASLLLPPPVDSQSIGQPIPS
eukprot:8941655-Pyramimonas_sp.AAC.1